MTARATMTYRPSRDEGQVFSSSPIVHICRKKLGYERFLLIVRYPSSYCTCNIWETLLYHNILQLFFYLTISKEGALCCNTSGQMNPTFGRIVRTKVRQIVRRNIRWTNWQLFGNFRRFGIFPKVRHLSKGSDSCPNIQQIWRSGNVCLPTQPTC